MRSWAEGALAIFVVVAVGGSMFLFAGDSGSDGSTATTVPVVFDQESATRGQVTAESSGCLQCHTVDGTPSSGPTWKGLAGSSRPLTTGESVIADDAYLRNSIIDPASQVIEGFDPIMPPDYGDSLDEQEINDLIAYINSLAN